MSSIEGFAWYVIWVYRASYVYFITAVGSPVTCTSKKHAKNCKIEFNQGDTEYY